MLNHITIYGRLTREPELKQTTSGKNVASFSLAVDRGYKDSEGNKVADFIPVLAWNKTAEVCQRFLAKGSRAVVSGRLQIRNYEDKNGAKRNIAEVIADSIEIIDFKEAKEQAPIDEDVPF